MSSQEPFDLSLSKGERARPAVVPLSLSKGHDDRLPPSARADREVVLGPADSEHGLSSVAAAYRRAEPYMAASSTLMASVGGFTALGYGLDRWLGHATPWMLIAGSVIGIAVGFVGFFTKVLRADAAAKHERA